MASPNIWFTSDTHFYHTNIIKFCNLPFSYVEEMNETIIDNWNKKVKPGDLIYHLGDVIFGSPEQTRATLKRLNGDKILIQGNHDNKHRLTPYFDSIHDYLFLKNIGKSQKHFVLFHYPIEEWASKYHGSIHLHGHSHGNALVVPKRLDMWTGNWGMSPVSLEEVLELTKDLEEAEE